MLDQNYQQELNEHRHRSAIPEYPRLPLLFLGEMLQKDHET